MIEEKLKRWFNELTIPRPELSNMPICPFAKPVIKLQEYAIEETEQLSLLVAGAIPFTTAVQIPGSVSCVTFATHVINGSSLSSIVTENAQNAELPLPSVIV